MREILTEWRHLDVSRAALRRFGRTVGLVFLALGAFVLWRRGWTLTPLPGTLLSVGAVLVGLGLAAPTLLRPVYRVWMLLAFALGFVMTRVLLTVVFFGVVTPIGLLRRALGHDPMRRKRDPAASTYWLPRPPVEDPRKAMERTF
ncbi:MAG TPA: SxtJ family membrane protein [Rhodothermales bacterium]|nr:SxtJ family membrane protein [Rhodothermales bacterium]